MDEAKTRQEVIDHRLGLAGWDVWDASQVIQELDIELAKAGHPIVLEPRAGVASGSLPSSSHYCLRTHVPKRGSPTRYRSRLRSTNPSRTRLRSA